MTEYFKQLKKITLGLTLLLFTLLEQSCYSTKRLQYFENLDTAQILKDVPLVDTSFSMTFQPYDMIDIMVNSADPALAAPFNLQNVTGFGGYTGDNSGSKAGAAISASINNPIRSFLIDKDGFINYPFLGKIDLKNRTIDGFKDSLTNVLRSKYIKDATVDIRLLNGQVTVIGEVGSGTSANNANLTSALGRTVPIPNGKLSILDAIVQSGGFSFYSNKKDVILIRQINNVKEFHHIDMSTTDAFKSPYYYLQQNDVVYIKPLKDKGFMNDPYSRRIFSYIGGLIGFITLLIAVSK